MMARKPKADPRQIDLVAVAAARARLAELAEQHPEAFAPDRLPITERKLARALAVNPDPLITTSVKLSASTRAALSDRAKALGTQPAKLARELIERGLAADDG